MGFIASPNAKIRLLATENLVPFSASQPALFKTDDLTPVKHLKFLIRDHPVGPRDLSYSRPSSFS